MNPFRKKPISSAGRVFALGLLLAAKAPACQICLPFPTESLADRILGAKHLVLARENPERPYTLIPTRSLEGESSTPLDTFLDSSSRRWLSFDESRSILCGWYPEEDQWRYLTRHDETIRAVVRDILSHREQWQANPESRYEYFADYLGNDNATLADLAHLEVARAPYDLLTGFANRISRERLLEELGNVRRIEWQALYILLLAQSGHPDDHRRIRDKVERNAHWGISLQTAAWATALIEVDGMAGIERLNDIYLGTTEREPEELAAIHAALRTHGDGGRPELRDPVVAAYGKILDKQPALAPDLADDLTRWNRFDHAEKLAEILKEGEADLVATSRIRTHLRAAEPGAGETAPETGSGRGALVAMVSGLLLVPLLLAFGLRPRTASVS